MSRHQLDLETAGRTAKCCERPACAGTQQNNVCHTRPCGRPQLNATLCCLHVSGLLAHIAEEWLSRPDITPTSAPSAGTWMKLDSMGDVPQARSFHVATAAGGKLYVFGGCGAGGRLNELHSYDPESNAWQQLPASDAVAVRPAH